MTTDAVRWRGLGALMLVYVVWGSTYLAIRVAVQEGSGFPAFWMAASRTLVGGAILLALAWAMGKPLGLRRSEWVVTVVSAILLWNGGNGMVTWAEQRAASGYAALVIGTTPLWGAVIDSVMRRTRPTLRVLTPLLTGFAGLAVLTGPALRSAERADLWSTVALLAAPVCWSLGSAYQQRRNITQPIMVSAGYQQLIGCVVFVLLALGTGEPWPTPTAASWVAWGYLVIFGSVIAFTAYVTALRALPLPVVMTYAYVNPVIAVLLGWWFLNEPVTWGTLAGTLLILAGVASLLRQRFR
jgi:drug/metabolite transporter (DMT)-like permease